MMLNDITDDTVILSHTAIDTNTRKQKGPYRERGAWGIRLHHRFSVLWFVHSVIVHERPFLACGIIPFRVEWCGRAGISE